MSLDLSLKSLENSGFVVLNDGPAPRERTLIVLGVARGGTSMVAAALHHLGVFMGPRLSAVYEDMEICGPMEASDRAAFDLVVRQRNAAHALWGFKRPGAVEYVRRYEACFRSPQYLLIFRDPFAIANRNALSMSLDIVAGLRRAQDELQRLVAFAAGCRHRTLLISYEKALLAPDAFVAALAQYVGISDPVRLAAARGAIEPGAERYLRQSRAWRAQGRLEAARGRVVRGWAVVDKAEAPVQVEVSVNGKSFGAVTASQWRQDLSRVGRPETGACGFRLELPPSARLKAGDEVRARVVGDVEDLRNSPLIVKP